ncbi:MAG: hypothetical protein ACYSTL_06955, partial [Planctomycetota bacterium]
MRSLIRYLRAHRWRRRVLTVTLALLGGLLAGVIIYPRLADRALLRDLGSEDSETRTSAILRATALADRSPEFLQRLEATLDTKNDTQFEAVATVLRRVGKFRIPTRDPLHVDRMRMLEFDSLRSTADPAASVETRRMILNRMLLSGR